MSAYTDFVKKEMRHRPSGASVTSYMKVIGKKWRAMKSKKGGSTDLQRGEAAEARESRHVTHKQYEALSRRVKQSTSAEATGHMQWNQIHESKKKMGWQGALPDYWPRDDK